MPIMANFGANIMPEGMQNTEWRCPMSPKTKVTGLNSATLMGFVPTKDAARARAFYEAVLGLPSLPMTVLL
jgi:hypothetical protein